MRALTLFARVNHGQRSCLKRHSEERSDEESVGGDGGAQLVPTTAKPFATLRVARMQFFLGKALRNQKGVQLYGEIIIA